MGQTSTRTLLLWRPLQIPFVFPFFSCNLKPGKRGRQQGGPPSAKASFVVLAERERESHCLGDIATLQQHDTVENRLEKTDHPTRPLLIVRCTVDYDIRFVSGYFIVVLSATRCGADGQISNAGVATLGESLRLVAAERRHRSQNCNLVRIELRRNVTRTFRMFTMNFPQKQPQTVPGKRQLGTFLVAASPFPETAPPFPETASPFAVRDSSAPFR